MKIGKFLTPNRKILWGIIEGERVIELGTDPSDKTKIPEYSFSDLKLLAPASPSKIIAIGKNYKAHAEEMGGEAPPSPIIFLKAPSSLINPGEEIVMPPLSSRVDYEAELAVVIGKTTKNISEDNALEAVWGFTCLNDVTARDLQKLDGQWARAKSFDTFCPIGPWLETEVDCQNIHISLEVNGEVKQSASTADMIFSVPFLISYISQVMTLNPGDVIATGTPSGIGPLSPGDSVTVKLEGIGELTNPVVKG